MGLWQVGGEEQRNCLTKAMLGGCYYVVVMLLVVEGRFGDDDDGSAALRVVWCVVWCSVVT